MDMFCQTCVLFISFHFLSFFFQFISLHFPLFPFVPVISFHILSFSFRSWVKVYVFHSFRKNLVSLGASLTPVLLKTTETIQGSSYVQEPLPIHKHIKRVSLLSEPPIANVGLMQIPHSDFPSNIFLTHSHIIVFI